MNREKLVQLGRAKDLSEILSLNMKAIEKFNEQAAAFMSTKFETEYTAEITLNEANERVRGTIRRILFDAYKNYDRMSILVLPGTRSEFEHLSNIVQQTLGHEWEKDSMDVVENYRLRYITYFLMPGWETVIVLDATQSKYIISDAEISGICVFVTGLISVIAPRIVFNQE